MLSTSPAVSNHVLLELGLKDILGLVLLIVLSSFKPCFARIRFERKAGLAGEKLKAFVSNHVLLELGLKGE